MTWTTARPTKAGWYWWRYPRYTPEVFYLDAHGTAYHWRDGQPITFPPGTQFQGPIEPEE